MRLGWCLETDCLSGRQALRTYFLALDQPRMRLWCFDNGMFLVVSSGLPAAANSFPANWPTKYATCVRLKKRCFKGSKGTLHSGQNKMILGSLRERDVSSGRQPLLIHFLLLDQHKMRHVWGRESHISRGRQAPWTHFQPLDKPKIRLWWGRESDVSRGRTVFWTVLRSLDQLKISLGWGRKRDVSCNL